MTDSTEGEATNWRKLERDDEGGANPPHRMSAGEFRELGLLQEVNRRVLHPLGLALEIVIAEDGSTRFGEVWDYRHDPEGIMFAVDEDDNLDCVVDFKDRAVRVALEWERRRDARIARLGFMVQPIHESVDGPLT